jgi:hypothetical protein
MHAFDVRDFTRAGEAFDACYQLAPHPDALWNGARAWHQAGELARAANRYARYLREAPNDAPDRPGALAAQKQLASKLARLEVHTAEGVTDVRVDDLPVDGPVVFVVPGVHALVGHTRGGDVEQRQTLTAGADVSVLISPPEEPPVAVTTAPSPAPPGIMIAAPPPSPEAPRHFTLPRAVVFVEAGVTLAVAGVTLWSGLDTLSTLRTFNATPTQRTLDAGRTEEVRTNVLLGASIGLAAVTGITAIWLVDWHRRGGNTAVLVGPGSANVRGSF